MKLLMTLQSSRKYEKHMQHEHLQYLQHEQEVSDDLDVCVLNYKLYKTNQNY